MAIVTAPSLTVENTVAMAETLHEGFYKNPAITAFHDIVEGIVAGKQLLIFKNHTGLSGYNTTGCDTTVNSTFAVTNVNKTWTPKFIGDRFAECYDTFMDKFFVYGLKAGVNKPDLTGTELAAFIEFNLDDEVMNVFLRHLWFGDTAIAAGTGNNLISAQLKYFNAINGFWKQLFTIANATPARLSATELATKNAEAAFADQKFNSTDTTGQIVTAALDQMYYDADERLTDMNPSDLVYICTKSVADQYARERKSVGAISEAYQRVENGVRTLYNNGIEVMPFSFQDRIINTYLQDGTAWVLPHRAILTTRKTLLIGTESIGQLGTLDPFYSKDLKKYIVDYGDEIDAKVGLNNMVQLAY